MESKICLYCNKVFSKPDKDRNWKKRKYCSGICAHRGTAQTRIVLHNEYKFCKCCNKKICWPKDSSNKSWENKKYCSIECALKSRVESAKGKWPKTRATWIKKGYWPKPPINHKRGEESPLWKGGRSLNACIRETEEYNLWRRKVFARDHYICFSCKKKGGVLNADHIVPFSQILREEQIKTKEEAFVNQRLWDMNNARTLCLECHKQTDTYLKGYKTYGSRFFSV